MHIQSIGRRIHRRGAEEEEKMNIYKKNEKSYQFFSINKKFFSSSSAPLR
jgi:hypothetical protein